MKSIEQEPQRDESFYHLLPQRPPFLFIDRIIESTEISMTTELFLTGKEDFFKGHFPGNPVMPGVLMCEACFQTAAAFMGDKSADGTLGVVTKIEMTKFKKMAKPGDVLKITVTKKEEISNLIQFDGKIEVEGKKIMMTKFSVAGV